MASNKHMVSLPSAVRRWRLVGLIVGDACVFLIFAAIGRASHHETSGLAAFWLVVQTAAPFALGWFVVAPFWGVYRDSVTSKLRSMLGHTALGWLCAWPVAMLLRWLYTLADASLNLGDTQAATPLSLGQWISFSLVVLIVNMLFLNVWRALFALVANRGR